jgi:uncharacterized protein (TIGR00369 family)
VDLEALRRLFNTAIPFNAFLGLKIVELERGTIVAELPFRADFIGDPVRQAMHGGVISMVADTVGGGAIFTHTDPGDRVATIDLRVDYLRPGRNETLRGRAKVVRIGNRVGVSQIEVYHPGSEDEPVAVAMGVYTIKRASEQ